MQAHEKVLIVIVALCPQCKEMNALVFSGSYQGDRRWLVRGPGLKTDAARSMWQALDQLGHRGCVQPKHALPREPGCPLGQSIALQQRAPGLCRVASRLGWAILRCHPVK